LLPKIEVNNYTVGFRKSVKAGFVFYMLFELLHLRSR
jgi:hypothetical protein